MESLRFSVGYFLCFRNRNATSTEEKLHVRAKSQHSMFLACKVETED